MRVYISGPMRGMQDYNYPLFNEVEKTLFEYGLDHSTAGLLEVCNPTHNFNGDQTLPIEMYMNADLRQVLDADALVLLPGWEHSEGSKLEITVAQATGKSFYLAVPQTAVEYERRWSFVPMDEPVSYTSPRASALDEAKALITGDRNNAYGPPTQDFDRTARMANGFGFQVNGQPLQAHHVAVFMILLKMSRLAWTPGKRDSWVDTAGYAGCGYECAVESER